MKQMVDKEAQELLMQDITNPSHKFSSTIVMAQMPKMDKMLTSLMSYTLAAELPTDNSNVTFTEEEIVNNAVLVAHIKLLKQELFAIYTGKDISDAEVHDTLLEVVDRLDAAYYKYAQAGVTGSNLLCMMFVDLVVPVVTLDEAFSKITETVFSTWFPDVTAIALMTKKSRPVPKARVLTRSIGRPKGATRGRGAVDDEMALELPAMHLVAIKDGCFQGLLPTTHDGVDQMFASLNAVRLMYKSIAYGRTLTPGEITDDEPQWSDEAFDAYRANVMVHVAASKAMRDKNIEYKWELMMDELHRGELDDATLAQIKKGTSNFIFVQTLPDMKEGHTALTTMTFAGISQSNACEMPLLDQHDSRLPEYAPTIDKLNLKIVALLPPSVCPQMPGFMGPCSQQDLARPALYAADMQATRMPSTQEHHRMKFPLVFAPRAQTEEDKVLVHTIGKLVGTVYKANVFHLFHDDATGYSTSSYHDVENKNYPLVLVDSTQADDTVDGITAIAQAGVSLEAISARCPGKPYQKLPIYTLNGAVLGTQEADVLLSLFATYKLQVPLPLSTESFTRFVEGDQVERRTLSDNTPFFSLEQPTVLEYGADLIPLCTDGIPAQELLVVMVTAVPGDNSDDDDDDDFDKSMTAQAQAYTKKKGNYLTYYVQPEMRIHVSLWNPAKTRLELSVYYIDENEDDTITIEHLTVEPLQYFQLPVLPDNAGPVTYGTFRIHNKVSGKDMYELEFLRGDPPGLAVPEQHIDPCGPNSLPAKRITEHRDDGGEARPTRRAHVGTV